MKISVLSDLHIDFHIRQRDPNRITDREVADTFEHVLNDSTDVEVLVVAGDVGHYNTQDFRVLSIIAKMFNYKKIFVVAGNHTFYKSSRASTVRRISEFWIYVDTLGVIEVLNGDVVEYKGVKFGGAMGWAYGDPYINKTLEVDMSHKEVVALYRKSMNDMKYIDFLTDPKDMYDIEIDKIRAVYDKCDVMITHYNPTIKYENQPQFYRGELTTGFYCMDLEGLIAKSSAGLWIYGHQHDRAFYDVGGTSVICNAFGYPSESINTKAVTLEI